MVNINYILNVDRTSISQYLTLSSSSSSLDFAFGKCVSRYDNDAEDLRRSRLSLGQSKVLATMLQEMQGAGLTWDHPFVQCRMQGALFALREKTPMPPNLCGHLAPAPEIRERQSPLAYVRFTAPEEDYLDEDDMDNELDAEEFYSPVKKSSSSSMLSERLGRDGGYE